MTEDPLASNLFGGISIIGSKGMNSSLNCGMPTESLRDLCKEL
jgi:cobalamin biosynthesis protein CbiD